MKVLAMTLLLMGFGSVASGFENLRSRAQFYNERYHRSEHVDLSDLRTKLDDTTGRLRRLRNMRTVIPGAYYRGGNNGGTEPLTQGGLLSLCREGFSGAVYLYASRTRQDSVECTDYQGRSNTLTYYHVRYTSQAGMRDILQRIKLVLEQPEKGPIYVHCWGGAHAAGQVAAIAMKQWCGWNDRQAVDYWASTAHAQSDVRTYPHVPRAIRKFSPLDSLETAVSLERVCPR